MLSPIKNRFYTSLFNRIYRNKKKILIQENILCLTKIREKVLLIKSATFIMQFL
mgnify:FL=1